MLTLKPTVNDVVPVPQGHNLSEKGFRRIGVDRIRDEQTQDKSVDQAKY